MCYGWNPRNHRNYTRNERLACLSNEDFQTSGFYSGGHSNSIRSNLRELLFLWNERDGLETLVEVLADSLDPGALERLVDAISWRVAKG